MMGIARVSNKNARPYVKGLEEFIGHNTQGVWTAPNHDSGEARYVVYSYGSHWPMFVYDGEVKKWCENSDKYSVSTSKQHTQLHPHPPEGTVKMDKQKLFKVIAGGMLSLLRTPNT